MDDEDRADYWIKRAKVVAEHDPLRAATYSLIAIAILFQEDQ
jgi:hypothetical protein